MLRHTFQHFRGTSAKRERELWAARVWDWEAYEAKLQPQGALFDLPDPAYNENTREVLQSRNALIAGDANYFAERLDRQEHYRVALSFPSDVLFLDIETTGLSRYYDIITVIGWSMGGQKGFFVRGGDLGALKEVLSRAKAVVTFNGTLFDLPFIRHEFPELALPAIHVDLRFLARRADLTGGQKEIERILGVTRDQGVVEVGGEMAPVLWNAYTRGDTEALRRLLRYNAADLDGMKNIFNATTVRLLAKAGFPLEQCPQYVFPVQIDAESRAGLERDIQRVTHPWPSTSERKLRLEDLVFVDRIPRLKVVGIDLTGSEKRPSGWCLLDGREVVTATLSGDEEIIARTIKEKPHVISIDSPLSLPDGRLTVYDDDPGRDKYGIMRQCERLLKRRGVNVYPALLPSMQRLTGRGIYLASRFRSLGFPVIESYPGAAQDIMGIPRKQKGLEYLEQGLAEFGVSGSFIKQPVSHDELDAITSAIVGVFFWAGQVERLGADPLGEEALFIPDLRVDAHERRDRLVVGFSGALGAGKTTAAEYLQSVGFTYCRYSQVIQRRVRARQPAHTREDLQHEGQWVHENLGQRWLGRELVRPLLSARFVVVDGLRFPDDHAFLTEVYGSQFLHIHIVASQGVRKERFEAREHTDFEVAANQPVELKSGDLEQFARDVVENNGAMSDYVQGIDEIIYREWR
jgi:uncharacterized protein YprB with RNaseH-like and TPR domain/predicted nuclease with RNAse H fold/dephospho-CoA kinase